MLGSKPKVQPPRGLFPSSAELGPPPPPAAALPALALRIPALPDQRGSAGAAGAEEPKSQALLLRLSSPPAAGVAAASADPTPAATAVGAAAAATDLTPCIGAAGRGELPLPPAPPTPPPPRASPPDPAPAPAAPPSPPPDPVTSAALPTPVKRALMKEAKKLPAALARGLLASMLPDPPVPEAGAVPRPPDVGVEGEGCCCALRLLALRDTRSRGTGVCAPGSCPKAATLSSASTFS